MQQVRQGAPLTSSFLLCVLDKVSWSLVPSRASGLHLPCAGISGVCFGTAGLKWFTYSASWHQQGRISGLDLGTKLCFSRRDTPETVTHPHCHRVLTCNQVSICMAFTPSTKASLTSGQ